MTQELYNLTFEKSILSAILFNPELFNSHKITPDYFYLPAHQNIYNAMSSLIGDDLPIDEEFLKQRLSKVGQFDESVMLDILSTNPIANIRPYIDELSKNKDRRNLLSLSNEIKKAVDSEDPISAAKELIMALEGSMSINKRLPNPTSIDDIVECESEFILKNWLPFPKKTVSLVTAPGGSGKTWALLQIAARFCLEDVKNNRAFLWLSEDPKSLSKVRLRKILDKVIKTSSSSLKIDLADDSTPQLLNIMNNKVIIDPIWHDLKRIFDNYDLIILDPLIAFFGGDENNNGHARFFMQMFTEYASKNDKIIIFIHHSTKGTAGSRGAGAIVDAARLHYEVDRIKIENKEIDEKKLHMRSIRLAKDNYNAAQYLQGSVVERQIFPNSVSSSFVIAEYDESQEKIEIPIMREF